MKTIPTTLLVKDSLEALAMLDNELRLVTCSNAFIAKFATAPNNLEGKNILDIIPYTPTALKLALEESLTGVNLINAGERFVLPNGSVQWIKWKIQCVLDESGKTKGLMVILEDITKDKRENELLLRAELVSRTGSWEVDLLQDTLFWSPMTRIIHEVPEDYIPTIAGGINFYKEGYYRNLISELVNDAIVEGKPWDTELIIVTTTGKEIWVRAKGESELVNGKCIRISGTFQDIDEKKKIELKYKETAERLKIATNTSKIGIWDLNIEENVVVCNDNMYSMYNIPMDSSNLLDEWMKRIHPEDLERVQEELNATIAGEKPFNSQFRGVQPDGNIIYLIAYGAAQKNSLGEIVKVIGANWDITELRSTQLKLERNKESFLDTFTNSAIGMALINLEGEWIRVNKTICTIFGYTQEELAKTTFKDITYPEDLEMGLVLFQEILNGKRDSFQLEKRYTHKTGRIVYAVVNVTAAKDINGQLSHLIAQVMDTTSTKTAEKRLNSLLQVTKVQNDSLLNFAHIVSHNLRSHSSNMSMLTKFLLEENDEEERQNMIRMLVDATDSLTETIQHLNDVVQVKTDATENMRSVNLLHILNQIENSIKGLLTQENAKTHIKVSKAHNVKVVPAYLESILLNLYTNSLKYRSPFREPILNISSSKRGNTILIEFNDNGLGIDLKRHGAKLFGMYKTFHKHKEAKGIGLFITKNQIESMNGSITVESTVDVGTTFLITLEQG
ncbi:PAS domain S-box protein [Maribacter chungangensis]|uniref:histidine kinase n=1 Tax=Maribacter chungangensis TaxID=1069117 RepID=A0ABW3B6W8_9FLAO